MKIALGWLAAYRFGMGALSLIDWLVQICIRNNKTRAFHSRVMLDKQVDQVMCEEMTCK